ncbi:hypothetical protein PV326_013025, partial [Microctonus aethiopoides]
LKNFQLESIAKLIVEIFPTESPKTFYVGPISKALSRTNKSISASGKLVDKYRNKLRQKKELAKMQKKRDTEESPLESDDEDDEKKAEHSIEWPKVHRNPWNDVLNHWRITFDYRRRNIRKNKGGKVNLLLEEWPILKQPNGFLLIESDFDDMKLTKIVNTKEIWDKFSENVHTIQPYNDRDANAACLHDLLILDDHSDGALPSCASNFLIVALHSSKRLNACGKETREIFNNRIQEQHDHTRYILYDMRIIKFNNNRVNFLLQRPGDIVTAQEEKVKKYADRGTPLQPYMIVVGETLTTLSEFYVCVDKLLY